MTVASRTAGVGAAALAVAGLFVRYGERRALEDVTFELERGTFAAVLGPNGAGKTTLLRALLGVVASTGSISAPGRMAYVPQSAAVAEAFPVDALGVVLMGRYPRLGWRRRPGRADRRLAAALLDDVGLADRARSQFASLSGGQRQRVLVARALAQEGELLLLDEPLTGIDAPSQETILRVIGAQRRAGGTVLMTTHDLAQAARECDRLLLLNGSLVAAGTPAEVLRSDVLRRAYRAEVVLLGDGAALLDDCAHPDREHDPSPGPS